MRFDLGFTRVALPKWKRLDFDLQELALDALEALLDSPPNPAADDEETKIIVYVVEAGRERHLTLRIGWLFDRQTAVIGEVEYWELP